MFVATDWGKWECEDGAFDGVPSRVRDDLALTVRLRVGLPIKRADVVEEIRGARSRLKETYQTWESDASAWAASIRKAAENLGIA